MEQFQLWNPKTLKYSKGYSRFHEFLKIKQTLNILRLAEISGKNMQGVNLYPHIYIGGVKFLSRLFFKIKELSLFQVRSISFFSWNCLM